MSTAGSSMACSVEPVNGYRKADAQPRSSPPAPARTPATPPAWSSVAAGRRSLLSGSAGGIAVEWASASSTDAAPSGP
eukprot:1433527-Alexandrium_andersonii.AAC.1